MATVTIEKFINDLRGDLNENASSKRNVKTLIKQMNKSRERNATDRESIIKIAKIIVGRFEKKQFYILDKIEAMKVIQGDKERERTFEAAAKDLTGKSITVKKFISSLEDILYNITDLKYSAQLLAEWLGKSHKEKIADFKDMEKITERIADYFEEKRIYILNKIEAMKEIRGDKKKEKGFEIAMEILKEE